MRATSPRKRKREAVAGCRSPPGPDPPKPKPGDLSDFAEALYKTEVVQGLVKQAHDELWRQLRVLRLQWQQSNTGTKVASVSLAGLVAGSTLAAILANKRTREGAFGLLKNGAVRARPVVQVFRQ